MKYGHPGRIASVPKKVRMPPRVSRYFQRNLILAGPALSSPVNPALSLFSAYLAGNRLGGLENSSTPTAISLREKIADNHPLILIPTPRFLEPHFPRLSLEGIHGDRKQPNKPITNPSQRNEPIIQTRQKHTPPPPQKKKTPSPLRGPCMVT